LDGTRFDAWTRRRFGLATGGAVAGLLGLASLHEAEAKKKNKKKRKKKKQCKKLGQGCDTSVKKKKCCSERQLCSTIQGQGSRTFCCKQNGEGCSRDEDCCGNDFCGNDNKCRIPS
jgi:hypothetical protein